MDQSDSEMLSVFGCDIGEAEITRVVECMHSQWLGCGDEVLRFEREFATTKSLNSFSMVDNGSNALYLAVKLLDLPPNSEIIVPSFNWVACALTLFFYQDTHQFFVTLI